MVLTLLRALPGVHDLLVTVACRSSSADLAPAKGRQDHTTWQSAPAALVARAASVHRIPRPTLVTIAKRPSRGCGIGEHKHIFTKNGRKIFKTSAGICKPFESPWEILFFRTSILQ